MSLGIFPGLPECSLLAQKPPIIPPSEVSNEVRGQHCGLSLHALCIRAVKALARMGICLGLPELSLLDNKISTKLVLAQFIIQFYCDREPLNI